MRTRDRSLHSRLFGNVLDLSAEHFHQFHLFHGKAFGHAQNNTIPARDADQREANSGVAGCWFDDRRAWSENAPALRVQNHTKSGAIFNTTAGIEIFELGVNVCKRRRSKMGKVEQGCVTYQIDDTFSHALVH